MKREQAPATEQIMDWFERNPTSKMRCGPLARALKMDTAKAGGALANLADRRQLMRIKIDVPANERNGKEPKEQWEYWLPLAGKAPEPVKPYKPAPAVHRAVPDIPSKQHEVMAKPGEIKIAVARSEESKQNIPVRNDEATETVSLKLKLAELQKQLDDQCELNSNQAIQITAWKKAAKEVGVISAEEMIAAFSVQDTRLTDQVRKTNEALERAGQLEDALQQAGAVTTVAETRQPAGYIVARPKKPLRRLTKLESAQGIALGAVRAGGTAEVFSLHPVGKAVRSAEWKGQ